MKEITIKKIQIEKTDSGKHTISLVFNYVAFHYVTAGYGFFNGKRLGAGDGFVCNIDCYCNYYPDPNDPWEYVWMIVSDEGNYVTTEYQQNGYTFKFLNPERFKILCTEFSANQEKLADKEYSSSVFNIIKSYHTNYKIENPESCLDLVAKSKIYMEERIHKSIVIEEIADMFHISSGYLRYLFKSQTGLSPKQYLISMKIKRAQSLLISTDYCVGYIAASVGYDDIQEFSKLFKKHSSLSPMQYRKLKKVKNP